MYSSCSCASCSNLWRRARTAARALLIESQDYLSKAELAAERDDQRQVELERLRNTVSSALEGTVDNVMNLPRVWTGLQQQLALGDDHDPRDFLLLTSISICRPIGQALQYRLNGSLYGTPDCDATSPHFSPPWTSSLEMLKVLSSQLQVLHLEGESVLATSFDVETDKVNLRQFVEDISALALTGYHDFVLRNPHDEETKKAYENAKELSTSLLRQYANDNGDDLTALNSCIAHCFFEGIVQICHDHQQSWKFRGPFSDRKPDERYDLRFMLSSTSPESLYEHLHQSRDYRTGLSFCGYVLRWYADRRLYPEGK